MATPKQIAYIRHLMIEAGHVNPRYGSMAGSAKRVPHSPTMRERRGHVDDWAARLTVRQASDVISVLQ